MTIFMLFTELSQGRLITTLGVTSHRNFQDDSNVEIKVSCNNLNLTDSMCELFGMSSLELTSINFSLEEFARHGGDTGPHKDGWGVAFYDQEDVQLIREASDASSSPLVESVKQHHFLSDLVISHIRYATQGEIHLKNTQPFVRELGGYRHTYAHNGDLKGIKDVFLNHPGRFRPVGNTDSELAYCFLMNQMEAVWLGQKVPLLEERLAVFERFCKRMQPLGPANFLYSDSEYLYVHAHKRTQPGREGYFPPGLHFLGRTCSPPKYEKQIRGLDLKFRGKHQSVVLVATIPLTGEGWTPMKEGEIMVLRKGRIEYKKSLY